MGGWGTSIWLASPGGHTLRQRRSAGNTGGASIALWPGGYTLSWKEPFPIAGAFVLPEDGNSVKHLGPMQTVKLPRRKFRDSDAVDFAIVGVGSAGGVLLQR